MENECSSFVTMLQSYGHRGHGHKSSILINITFHIIIIPAFSC